MQPTSRLARLRKADIPWVHHALTLLTTLYIFPIDDTRTFLCVYAILTILLDTEKILAALQDPKCPPMIPHAYIPFLGHVIGMFTHGASYFSRVNNSTQHPIYTLQTVNAKTIVVTDPALVTIIQKKTPNLSFYGMILEVTKRLVDFDDASMKVIMWNLDGKDSPNPHDGLMRESEAMIGASLAPGPGLNDMSATQLEQFSILLNDFVPTEDPGATGKISEVQTTLMQFVKDLFTPANAHTIYGPLNPFALDPSLVQDFWTYEAGMIGVMADILPSVTARPAWLARRRINRALHTFVTEGHYKRASPMIQRRVAINLKHGLTEKMAGRCELILLFGILGNAVPSTFWLLANILARPELLEALRSETMCAITTQERKDGGAEGEDVVNVLSVSTLKSSCPLLLSTYRESLRHIANLSSVRLVVNSHEVNVPGYPTYKLEKGSMIQMASGVIHVREKTWGEDASEFRPERWMDISSDSTSPPNSEVVSSSVDKSTTALPLPPTIPSSAFRAFGGGSVICPGRHFAQTEILGFVVAVLHMFDIVDAEKGKEIQLPERDNSRIPLSVMKPFVDPGVRIRRRGRDVWRVEL